MYMTESIIHEYILKSIHSPYNIHILNITHAIESINDIQLHNLFDFNANYIQFESIIFNDFNDIRLNEALVKSTHFLNIIENAKKSIILLQESEYIKKCPLHVHKTLSAFKQVFDAYILNDEYILDKSIEELEQYLDIVDSINIQNSIKKIVKDESNFLRIWKVIIEISSSIYGIISSISIDSCWNTIISDMKCFCELKQILEQKYKQLNKNNGFSKNELLVS